MNSRRDFLSKSLLAVAAASLPISWSHARPALAAAPTQKITLKQNDIILFQGDSITDAGRNKEILDPNVSAAFGNGYAMLAASQLLNNYADKNLRIYNRGISGNRVPDLQTRWAADTIALKPTLLSIMIGVNDFWRTIDRGAVNSAANYKGQYQKLLDDTLKQLPGLQLIIAEPFAVKDVKYVDNKWYPDFLGYQEAAKELAAEYRAVFIPYQSIFDQAEKKQNGSYWTTDGVHTTLAGANLMAQGWLDAVQ